MTIPPIITPLLQWSDADGKPYAGGSIETYIVGTSTPKSVWVDPDQAALATNPVVLDAAGRSLMFGDGSYRLVLRDSVGNLVADFVATTLVSAAMMPVVSAPTIADAKLLLGIDGSVADEAAARAAADSAEQTARIAADNALGTRIDGEVTARTNGDANLQTQIDAITGATGPVGVLPEGYSMRFGTGLSDGGGNYTCSFSPAFPNACDSVVTTITGISWWVGVSSFNAGGFSGVTSSPLFGGDWHGGPQSFNYIAIGH